MNQPTLTEMLEVARNHDANIQSRNVKIGRAIQQAAHQEVTMPAPSKEAPLDLYVEEDPFGGNLNNRRVAARIARAAKRQFLNNSTPTHVGDPVKAAKDVELSLRLNPDSDLPSSDEQVMIDSKVPSPGSPAALKAVTAPQMKTFPG